MSKKFKESSDTTFTVFSNTAQFRKFNVILIAVSLLCKCNGCQLAILKS